MHRTRRGHHGKRKAEDVLEALHRIGQHLARVLVIPTLAGMEAAR